MTQQKNSDKPDDTSTGEADIDTEKDDAIVVTIPAASAAGPKTGSRTGTSAGGKKPAKKAGKTVKKPAPQKTSHTATAEKSAPAVSAPAATGTPHTHPAWAEALIIALACILTSLLLFSNLTQRYSSSAYPVDELNLTTLSPYCSANSFDPRPTTQGDWGSSGITLDNGVISVPAGGGNICLSGVNEETKAVEITTAPASDGTEKSTGILTITAIIRDEANAPGYASAATLRLNPQGTHATGVMRMKSNGKASDIYLTLAKTDADYRITGITINPPWRFHLAWGPTLILLVAAFAVWALSRTRARHILMDWDNRVHVTLYWVSVAVAGLIPLIILIWLYSPQSPLLSSWSAGDVQNQYAAQADAWLHHHAALDDTPSDALQALENPYSRSARDDGNVNALWDVAYYNGKYYSYFGVTPLFLAYFPVRLITGSYPSAIFASTIIAIFAVWALGAALREMLVTLQVRSALVLTVLTPPALAAGSLVYLNQSSAAVYNMALLAALVNGAAAVAAGLNATRSEGARRVVMFVLSGLFLGLQFMSRPNSILVTIPFLAPLFIGVLRDRASETRQKITDAVSFCVPAVFVAVLQFIYNAARFSGPFDFGSSYQITVADMRTSSAALDPLKVKDMILDYWLMPPKMSADFPWVDLQSAAVGSGYGNYSYLHWMVGMLWLPLIWFVFAALSRRAERAIGRTGRIMAVCAFIGSLVLLYINYAMAGAIFRYYCDALWVLQLVAATAMLGRVRPKAPSGKSSVSTVSLYMPAVVALAVTCVMGLLLVLATNRQSPVVSTVNPDAYLSLAAFFS